MTAYRLQQILRTRKLNNLQVKKLGTCSALVWNGDIRRLINYQERNRMHIVIILK